jgi:hypothetical protein
LSVGGYFSDAANTTGIVRKAVSGSELASLHGRVLSLQLPQAANVHIDFLDVSGRVAASRTVALATGDQQVTVPAEVRGLSVVRVRTGNASQSFLATLP